MFADSSRAICDCEVPIAAATSVWVKPEASRSLASRAQELPPLGGGLDERRAGGIPNTPLADGLLGEVLTHSAQTRQAMHRLRSNRQLDSAQFFSRRLSSTPSVD